MSTRSIESVFSMHIESHSFNLLIITNNNLCTINVFFIPGLDIHQVLCPASAAVCLDVHKVLCTASAVICALSRCTVFCRRWEDCKLWFVHLSCLL